MFNFFKKKENKAPIGAEFPLRFKNNEAAFAMACKYFDNAISANKILPAIVLDSRLLFGTQESIKIQEDGCQIVMLKIASSDNDIIIPASTVSAKGPKLNVGDLVAWKAGEYSTEVAKFMGSKEMGWVGLIIAKLEPEHSSGHWKVAERFKLDYE